MTSVSRCMFDRTALPLAESFYRSHVKKFRLTGRRKAVGLCPFHDDHTPSLSIDLERGLFHCFGCGEGGDMITFVMKLYRLGFPDACKYLGAWRVEGLSKSEQRQLARARNRRKRAEADAQARRELEHAQRIDTREWLHATERLYDEAIAEHDWYLLSELLPRVRQCERTYWQLCGLEVRHER